MFPNFLDIVKLCTDRRLFWRPSLMCARRKASLVNIFPIFRHPVVIFFDLLSVIYTTVKTRFFFIAAFSGWRLLLFHIANSSPDFGILSFLFVRPNLQKKLILIVSLILLQYAIFPLLWLFCWNLVLGNNLANVGELVVHLTQTLQVLEIAKISDPTSILPFLIQALLLKNV